MDLLAYGAINYDCLIEKIAIRSLPSLSEGFLSNGPPSDYQALILVVKSLNILKFPLNLPG